MRRKKDSALGVKFVPGNRDAITNMEGALHTFVTPVVEAVMHGDYRYLGGHTVVGFADVQGPGGLVQQARKVVVSAAVQMDFEYRNVMMAVCRLGEAEVEGEKLGAGWVVLGDEEKWKDGRRGEYDEELRRHMVAHLTASGSLPSLQEAGGMALSATQALQYLERHIRDPESSPRDIEGVFVRLRRDTISLELLYNTALHQLRNELSVLEAVCPQGYVYTCDPPSIFAQALGGASLPNRLQFAALKHLASSCTLANLRAFAFNDYADPGAMVLLRSALQGQPHVEVLPKAAFFRGRGGTYQPGEELGGALLVVHNNSDAFGQNVESEWATGSLDGAVGAASSAAASLLREREDLLDWVM